MSADVASSSILRWFCGRLDERSRPWGEAILAELGEVRGRGQKLLWVLGGAAVMMRMLARQWLFPGSRKLTADPLDAATRPPRRWPPYVFVLLILSLFALPQFREALSIVRGGVTTFRNFNPKPDPAQFERAASKARAEKNAPVLALLAMSASDIRQQRQLSDEAIALDPSLTWINSAIIQRDRDVLPYAVGADSYSALQRAALIDAERRVAALEQWDPGNAVPYLLEGDLRLKRVSIPFTNPFEYEQRLAREGEASLTETPQESFQLHRSWIAAMDRAFSAPRYDSYLPRRVKLASAAPEAFGSSAPWMTVAAFMSHPIPNMRNMRSYADILVGPDAHARDWRMESRVAPDGHRYRVSVPQELPPSYGDPRRIHNYWRVSLFGARMGLGAKTDIEHLIASAIETIGARPLQVALRKTGQAEQAEQIGSRLQQLLNDRSEVMLENQLRGSANRMYERLAIAVDAAAYLAILALLLWTVPLAYTLSRPLWNRSPAGRLDRALRALACWMPAFAFVCLGVVLACYWPFARFYQAFIASPERYDYRAFENFYGFIFLPGLLHEFWYFKSGAYVAWWASIALLVGLAAWRVPHIFRGHPAMRTS